MSAPSAHPEERGRMSECLEGEGLAGLEAPLAGLTAAALTSVLCLVILPALAAMIERWPS